MRILLAGFLALVIIGQEARACSNLADLLFGKQPDWDRHLDDEALGDEFKRR